MQAYFNDTNSEFRLVSNPLPELYKLKSAHLELFQAYAESLAAVSRLTFFIRKTEVKPTPEGKVASILLYKIIWGSLSPLRLLIWRPVVSLYLQAHIHKKISELERGYTLAYFLLKNNQLEEKKVQDWLLVAKEECQRLLETVGAGKLVLSATNFFLIAILNFLFAIWGANNFSDLLLKVFTSSPPVTLVAILGQIIIFTIFMLPFVLTFISAAFSVKREIFSHINAKVVNGRSIYQLENTLFDHLRTGKSKEFPIDFSVTAFFYSIPMLVIWSFHVFVTESAKYTSTIPCDIFLCLLLPLFGMFGTDVLSPWIRRSQIGEM